MILVNHGISAFHTPDTTYPILYRSRRQKERELKRNYNQISILNQILVKGGIDHKVQLLGSAKT